MTGLARTAAPAVFLLEVSSSFVLGLLGRGNKGGQGVTEEEIRALIAEGESVGVVESAERHMIARVMRLGDRSVRGIMRPRAPRWTGSMSRTVCRTPWPGPHQPAFTHAGGSGRHRRAGGRPPVKDVLRAVADGEEAGIARLARPAPTIHDRADALDALEVLRASPVDMA